MAAELMIRSGSGASALILTSGASGRIRAIFSLQALRSLVKLITAVVLLLLLPFRGRRRTTSSLSSSAAAAAGEVTVANKDEKQVVMRKGAVVRVPAAIVPSRRAAVAADQEVAARRGLAIRRVLQDKDKSCVRDFEVFVSTRGDNIFTQSWTPASVGIRFAINLNLLTK
ncbi:hypothetical protein TIFTF001_015290 [Ficus carica]|uniref:Uncharacterized protein n=1 Tax=Ficus carica TaxID=3494 RepID=A0AA88AHI7_FICCA|nr:hypothetical protein TIFTF001_015290 [Ficus carica]